MQELFQKLSYKPLYIFCQADVANLPLYIYLNSNGNGPAALNLYGDK